jgi:O-antigen ligase
MVVTASLLLALPWLNPITYGPTHPVVQFLMVWIGAVLCGLVCAQARMEAATRAQVVAGAWLLAACASAAMGLLQYLGHSAAFSPWINYVEAGQAYANLRQRNQQATLLALGLCALLWWQLQGLAKAAEPPRRVALAWGSSVGVTLAALLLASADAASGSRTGMLQLGVLMALGLVWRRGRATLLLVLLAYAAAAWVLPGLAGLDPLHSGILGRLGEPASACASRLTLWSNVLQLIAQRPWTGWGWGELGYAHLMNLYAGPRFCEIMGNAHNLPLHLAVELGLPVALLVCGTLLWLALRAAPWRERDATRQLAWSVLAVIGAHSLLEYPLWYGPFQLAALLAAWLLWQTPRLDAGRTVAAASQRRAVPGAASARWSVALACSLLLACSYAAWDYWRISQIYLGEAQRAPSYRENTLQKIQGSWLFAEQVQFAELGTTPLAPDNAAQVHALALQMLHFSPEPSVLGKLIQSATLLGLQEEADAYRLRFQVAYAAEYADWTHTPAAGARSPRAPITPASTPATSGPSDKTP